MHLKEKATHVKVIDGGRSYYYWVTTLKPSTIKHNAISKHCKAMGIPRSDSLTAEILPDKEKAEKADTVQESLRYWIAVVEDL
jgi:hypothetical protein